MNQAVTVLCVAPRSVYKTLGVECYDAKRDARSFVGSSRIVAHPPCRSWSSKCSHQAKPLPGEKELGPFCVDLLERNGGILEHPANSRLFSFCGLPRPGEMQPGRWSISVPQSWWGADIAKNTWLCFFGISPLKVEYPFALHGGGCDERRWQLKSAAQRSATSEAMARWLVNQAAA